MMPIMKKDDYIYVITMLIQNRIIHCKGLISDFETWKNQINCYTEQRKEFAGKQPDHHELKSILQKLEVLTREENMVDLVAEMQEKYDKPINEQTKPIKE